MLFSQRYEVRRVNEIRLIREAPCGINEREESNTHAFFSYTLLWQRHLVDVGRSSLSNKRGNPTLNFDLQGVTQKKQEI